MDVSNSGVSSSKHYNRIRMSCDYRGAREEHVDLILLDSLLIFDSLDIFSYTFTLACQDRLVNLERVALYRQETTVGGYPVAYRDSDDISWHKVLRFYTLRCAIPDNLGLIGRVFL